MVDDGAVLEAIDATKSFRTLGRLLSAGPPLIAVDGVSIAVYERETVALVGESGCGKSTLGRCLVGLERLTSGEIRYRGDPIQRLSDRKLRPLRRRIRIVFQDHSASLNPRRRVGASVATPLRVHGLPHEKAVIAEILRHVELGAEYAERYPHQLSGGQRQRVGIARAIAVDPELVVLDEPLSALDVSIQAQICNLLKDLQDSLGIAYLFISHDLGVVRQIADRVAVMYLGRIVELAGVSDLYNAPAHPYTEALLSAVPIPDIGALRPERIRLSGEVPSPLNPPAGCRFHPRCSYATDICKSVAPLLAPTAGGRLVACHHPRIEPTQAVLQRRHTLDAAGNTGKTDR